MTASDYRVGIKELPEGDRPRERLLTYGAEVLSDAELVAIALRSGTRSLNAIQVAQGLLKRFDGLAGLAQATQDEMAGMPGVGPAKAAQVLAAFELGRRLAMNPDQAKPRISTPENAARILMARIGNPRQEELWVMLLDTKHQVLRLHNVYRGQVDSASVRVCEVFREAVRDNAKAIIVAHNHPSDDVTPSVADIDITRDLRHAGDLLGIDLLDHIIVTRTAYRSLKQNHEGF
ncbi:MAG: DNA repair protein RadC [Chloroflexi bacterium]|nr:DNA repair protein RadC [Chloroflexota bacterium]